MTFRRRPQRRHGAWGLRLRRTPQAQRQALPLFGITSNTLVRSCHESGSQVDLSRERRSQTPSIPDSDWRAVQGIGHSLPDHITISPLLSAFRSNSPSLPTSLPPSLPPFLPLAALGPRRRPKGPRAACTSRPAAERSARSGRRAAATASRQSQYKHGRGAWVRRGPGAGQHADCRRQAVTGRGRPTPGRLGRTGRPEPGPAETGQARRQH